MSTFEIHTIETAPVESIPALRSLERVVGFVPNLAATMADSPTLITGFVGLRKTLAEGELTGVEREIIALAVGLENDCDYCMAAHSTFALRQGAEAEAVHAARAGVAPDDPRLGALYAFARSLVVKRGHVSAEETQTPLDAGYSRGALFELVAQVGHTTLASLAANLSNAPVDDAFAPQAWARTGART